MESVDGKVSAVAERYSQMVYAAALRQTGDAEAARDVMQAVFLVLIQKEKRGKGPAEGQMAGWLLQVTRYVVKETRRASWRRRRREVAASRREMVMENVEGAELRGVLDAALLGLGTLDREVVVRRYLQGESVSAVGAAVGLSENSAGKRIVRALEKLRKILAGKGVSVPVGGVVGVMTAESAIHAPVAAAALLPGSQKVAKELARRVLGHTVVMQGMVVGGAVLMVCAIAAGVAGFVWRPAEVVAANLPASAPATPQAQVERLMHVGAVLEENSDRLVQQILAGIEANRAKLKTLEVEAEVNGSERLFTADDRYGDYRLVGKGWMEAGMPQRFRVEISLQRTPWVDGARPYLDDSFVATWDGAAARILHGPPHAGVRGEIGKNEGYGEGSGILGRGFSMQLMQDLVTIENGQEMKSHPLGALELRGMKLMGRRVVMNGREVMELETRFHVPARFEGAQRRNIERLAKRYWFDAARGYALMGYQEQLDGEEPLEELVVDEVVEAAPGVFYPGHARRVIYSRDVQGGSLHLFGREEFRATRVVANQAVDASMFRLEFPAAVSVTQRGVAGSQPATQR